MTSNASNEKRTTAASRRLVAALAAFFVLGVFFVLPLYAAVTLCSMPCCHPQKRADTVVTAAMNGCATECAVRADDVKPTTVVTLAAENTSHRGSPIVLTFAHVPDASIAPARIDRDAGLSHPADAPLHLLNSVFRI
jgi:hypothetical protein